MKVLLCSDSYYPHPGGVSEYMHFLGKHLQSLGAEIVILAPHYAEPYKDTLRTERIGLCYLFSGNMATITLTIHYKLPILVRDFIKKERFDIVHTNGPFGWTLPYWAFHYSRGCNVVTFHTAFAGFNMYKIAKVIFKREFQKRTHGAIYPSRAALNTTHPHFALPYRIIPNGIDIDRFNPAVKPLRKFQDARPKILFVGRMDPRKGLDRLLAAFPIVKQKIPEAVLVVVGSGPALQHYQRSVPKNLRSSVLFEGRVSAEALPRYYASSTVYVSPATGGEVFGIVLTEAMATSKPVVASNIPGYSEVIQDSVNGLLFDVDNTQDIADKIVTVLQNKKMSDALSKNARKRALEFSWQSTARLVLSYYEQLLKNM